VKLIKTGSFAVIILIFMCVLWIPFKLTLSSGHTIEVKSPAGEPIVGAHINHSWDQYPPSVSGEARYTTDQSGRAVLDSHNVKTNLNSIISGAIHNFLTYGIHASYKSDETIVIWLKGYNPYILKTKSTLSEGFL